MTRFLLIILAQLLMLSSVSSQTNCYELVWNDEFDKNGLPDTTKWTFETGGNGWGNNELQYYTKNRLQNARVEDGNLIVEAHREQYGGNNYTSARLITYHQDHSWKYGKIEARIKLPFGQGIWPAFWMLGDNIFESVSWPACGEIDILEMIGGGTGRDNTIHGTVHWSDASNNHASYGGEKSLTEGIFADDYHIFSVEWNENSIKWFLDGMQYHIVDISPSHMSEFHKNFFIILNVAVGGNWPGAPDASTFFPQKMLVDYVRVYQLKGKPKIIGHNTVVKSQKNVRFTTVKNDDFYYNWSVSGDAAITGGQGSYELTVDWSCATDTVFCQVISLCDTHNMSFPVNLTGFGLSGKDKVETGAQNIQYSVPLMANTSYTWISSIDPFKVYADSNVVNLNWGEQNGSIKLIYENTCGIDSLSKNIQVSKQGPYPDPEKPNSIPGIIESVNYDSGGEGISYHDTETANQGPGPRQDEGVDTETYNGEHNIGWLVNNEWLEYTIKVEQDTLYSMDALVASIYDVGKFRIYANNQDRTGIINVPNTASWSVFTNLTVNDIPFYTTDTIIKIFIETGDFNLGKMNFFRKPQNITRILYQTEDVFQIYSTIVESKLIVTDVVNKVNFQIINMNGQQVKKGILSTNPINVSDLETGIYLIIINHNGQVNSAKFIKI